MLMRFQHFLFYFQQWKFRFTLMPRVLFLWCVVSGFFFFFSSKFFALQVYFCPQLKERIHLNMIPFPEKETMKKKDYDHSHFSCLCFVTWLHSSMAYGAVNKGIENATKHITFLSIIMAIIDSTTVRTNVRTKLRIWKN